jgi:hypothetical protein
MSALEETRNVVPRRRPMKRGHSRQNETFEIFKKSVEEARVIGVLAVVFGIYVGFARDEATANFKMDITRCRTEQITSITARATQV